MSAYFFEIEQLVEQFIEKNRALNNCLQADQQFLSMNDFNAMEASDLQKVEIQTGLSEVLAQLLTHPALKVSYGDLFVKLSYYAGQLEGQQQAKLLKLVQAMREEFMAGTRLLMINRQVVNANLSNIKEIICHLTDSSSSTSSQVTYNHSAEIA
jgi:hypothetical protein